MSSEQLNSTDDEALSLPSQQQGAGGDLVRAFLNKKGREDRKWLESWFLSRIEKHFAGTPPGFDSSPNFDDLPADVEAATLTPHVKLKSMQAHYFRGFREGLSPINIGDDLIVIEGPNSSGKTSLAEALEWLFSGSLSRRESGNTGNARELEKCITNEFRPVNEETWVKAVFTSNENGETEVFTLRRELHEDYGTRTSATCNSVLFLNEKRLSPGEERIVLDRFFADVPPLLMQHTLRDFVQGAPQQRRSYFERLLRLDELTELIRLAVISKERADDFSRPSGGKFLSLLIQLSSNLENDLSRKAHSQILKAHSEVSIENSLDALTKVSSLEFPSLLEGVNNSEEIIAALKQEQMKVRQNSFPILAKLRPRKQLSNRPQESEPTAIVGKLGKELRFVWKQYENILQEVQKVGDKNLAVAKAFKLLLDTGAIQHERNSQTCPLCAYEHADTLSADRITAIEDWIPIHESERTIQQELEKTTASLVGVVKQALEIYDFLPSPPIESAWETAIQTAGDQVKEAIERLRTVLDVHVELQPHVSLGRSLIAERSTHFASLEQCESFIENCTTVVKGLKRVLTVAIEYSEALAAVEAAIGDETSKDPRYLLKEHLIQCFENASDIAEDLRWEQAKKLTQRELQDLRNSLIAYRQRFLEARRMSFNSGIELVWKSLRDERYSSFSQLRIPPPRGKGFPIEIELKAQLDDSNEKKEVDVLRVFSESQVNALGIAAFVTRAKLLGHRMLIFDDPVQSMDEDHFKTFARELIPQFLDDGFQVVLLTHNDTFARDVSHYHHERSNYITMSIRLSRRKGSVVDEGNRRVPERLKMAKRKAEEGLYGEAWRYIRLAIERLYTITYIKYGPAEFDPASWQHQPAEYMWKEGAGQVIQSRLPNSDRRLKEILGMTVGGAHDTAPKGETEIRKSLKFLTKATIDLKVGG